MLRKLMRFALRFALGFVIFVALYLLVAYCLSRLTVDREKGQAEELAIYIKTNGVHTDIVVPVKNDLIDWSRELCFCNTHLTDTGSMHYLAMGWGDKGFYLQTPTWADLKFSVAFKAAFALSTTAIHATFYDSLPVNDKCKRIMISRNAYTRLVNYITGSFQKDNNGHVIPIVTNANYGKADAFYEANGSYSMLHTCNTWANNALKSCGQKACWWTPFDTGIFLKYR
ncbi:MAG: TIGR02117 family protein [Bacteroidota bacterium]|nr:TIGR02117 family protein [Bacteroidota bacterium]